MRTKILDSDPVLPFSIAMLVGMRRAEGTWLARCRVPSYLLVERVLSAFQPDLKVVATACRSEPPHRPHAPRSQRRVHHPSQGLRPEQRAARCGDGVVKLGHGVRQPRGRRRGRAAHFSQSLRKSTRKLYRISMIGRFPVVLSSTTPTFSRDLLLYTVYRSPHKNTVYK